MRVNAALADHADLRLGFPQQPKSSRRDGGKNETVQKETQNFSFPAHDFLSCFSASSRPWRFSGGFRSRSGNSPKLQSSLPPSARTGPPRDPPNADRVVLCVVRNNRR